SGFERPAAALDVDEGQAAAIDADAVADRDRIGRHVRGRFDLKPHSGAFSHHVGDATRAFDQTCKHRWVGFPKETTRPSSGALCRAGQRRSRSLPGPTNSREKLYPSKRQSLSNT